MAGSVMEVHKWPAVVIETVQQTNKRHKHSKMCNTKTNKQEAGNLSVCESNGTHEIMARQWPLTSGCVNSLSSFRITLK